MKNNENYFFLRGKILKSKIEILIKSAVHEHPRKEKAMMTPQDDSILNISDLAFLVNILCRTKRKREILSPIPFKGFNRIIRVNAIAQQCHKPTVET